MGAPVVTIIVPIYNSAETIEACVNSIKAQTFDSWELILADNGSTDESPYLIRRIAETDSRITTINVASKGVANARNAAIDIATGEYVCFVDSDDTIETDYLERLCLNKNSDLVICGYYVDRMSTDGRLLSAEKYVPLKLNWDYSQSKNTLLPCFQNGFVHICCNKLFKRLIIEDYHIRFKGFPVNEDYLFVMEYLHYAKSISIIDAPLYHWIRVEGKETGVNSIPENLLAIYNESHLQTELFFNNKEIADKIAYYSYELIIYKYYHTYRIGRMSKSELKARLKELHRNKLVCRAYQSYKPSTKGERILYRLAKRGWFRIHYLLTQKEIL